MNHPQAGAVFVEFLIAALPVYVFFLCLVQLGLLFAVRLGVEHAAVNAARAAAVVIGDDPKRYGGEPVHQVQPGTGHRYQAIYDAALLTLSPWVLNGTIDDLDVVFPPEGLPGGSGRVGRVAFAPMQNNQVTKLRVRVEVRATCVIGLANHIACSHLQERGGRSPLSFRPSRMVRAEAVYPYQGASYVYSR